MANVDIGRYSKRLVQYFWDPLPRNEEAAPIWCLGKSYESKPSAPPSSEDPTHNAAQPLSVSHGSTASSRSAGGDCTSQNSSEGDGAQIIDDASDADADGGWPAPFLEDFEARVWLTYRSNFAAIPKSQDPHAATAMSFSVRLRSQLSNQGGFSSDTGWGCMIRALSNGYEDAGLRIYITGDGSDVYEDSFMKTAKDAKGSFHPTLVLVGIRLGIDRVTPVYWEALKASLQLSQSIGIAG
ncbi:Peptidase C54 [Neofusicoccum parvum]|uniref:Peptidase C54 n=1 Tax=Neofusicoccum parvum TaxID=310453 RepID=A0ACB5RNU5_9PEZI|nr:Peptidase C54 [Neofusicoccum parvum]